MKYPTSAEWKRHFLWWPIRVDGRLHWLKTVWVRRSIFGPEATFYDPHYPPIVYVPRSDIAANVIDEPDRGGDRSAAEPGTLDRWLVMRRADPKPGSFQRTL